MARAHQLVDRGDAPRPLVGLGLADQDRAGGAGAPQRLGVGHGHVVRAHRRAVRRAHALRVEQVLYPQREAGERPLRLTAAVGLLARARLGPGALQAERRERAEPAVDGRGARGHRFDRLHGGCLAAARFFRGPGVAGTPTRAAISSAAPVRLSHMARATGPDSAPSAVLVRRRAPQKASNNGHSAARATIRTGNRNPPIGSSEPPSANQRPGGSKDKPEGSGCSVSAPRLPFEKSCEGQGALEARLHPAPRVARCQARRSRICLSLA